MERKYALVNNSTLEIVKIIRLDEFKFAFLNWFLHEHTLVPIE